MKEPGTGGGEQAGGQDDVASNAPMNEEESAKDKELKEVQVYIIA